MIESYRGIAHPWLCDAMGHLNTRHYVAMFDDAAVHLLSAYGMGMNNVRASSSLGWADVKLIVELSSEVDSGGLVVIRSGIVRLGNTSVVHRHFMVSANGSKTHAQADIVTVCFDLSGRKSTPVPSDARERFEKIVITT